MPAPPYERSPEIRVYSLAAHGACLPWNQALQSESAGPAHGVWFPLVQVFVGIGAVVPN